MADDSLLFRSIRPRFWTEKTNFDSFGIEAVEIVSPEFTRL
jgi:hypothetical protein